MSIPSMTNAATTKMTACLAAKAKVAFAVHCAYCKQQPLPPPKPPSQNNQTRNCQIPLYFGARLPSRKGDKGLDTPHAGDAVHMSSNRRFAYRSEWFRMGTRRPAHTPASGANSGRPCRQCTWPRYWRCRRCADICGTARSCTRPCGMCKGSRYLRTMEQDNSRGVQVRTSQPCYPSSHCLNPCPTPPYPSHQGCQSNTTCIMDASCVRINHLYAK